MSFLMVTLKQLRFLNLTSYYKPCFHLLCKRIRVKKKRVFVLKFLQAGW